VVSWRGFYEDRVPVYSPRIAFRKSGCAIRIYLWARNPPEMDEIEFWVVENRNTSTLLPHLG